MKKLFEKSYLKIIPVIVVLFIAGCSSSSRVSESGYSSFDLDTVSAKKFDTGKMWTFDFPPVDYFESEYDFKLTEQWLDDVRLSALRFASWCSGSFISEDGLILTNYHCSEFRIPDLQKEGEDIRKNGFFAATLEDERRDPGVYVDQLISMEDVTEEVHNAIAKGETTEEKARLKSEIISQLQNQTSDDGLVYSVVELYNGGKYSLYGYKRYNDVRLVLMPESELGFFGGDPDNYTYPRYSLDFTLWRAYDENGEPLKVENYYKWSSVGAQKNEPTFVVGNPGGTNKLKSVAQLEYMRDYTYRVYAYLFDALQTETEGMIEEHPERLEEFVYQLTSYANVNKRYTGVLRGLRNEYYIARKKDFEEKLKEAVFSDPKLKEKYESVWDDIESTRDEMRQYANEYYAFSRARFVQSQYFNIALSLVELAEELQLPESQRMDAYRGDELETTINSIFPDDFDSDWQKRQLRVQADLMIMMLGQDNPLCQYLFNGYSGEKAVEYALDKAVIDTKEGVVELANNGAEAIMNSDDPFLYFVRNTKERYNQIQKIVKEINATEEVYENLLGQAIFDVYGTTIPPDGSSTLRLGDGVLKSYDYNGTIAPTHTTFYGMYDRFYSFDEEYPWSLPEKWADPPAEFDLETPFTFISTHDIVGGSSGSAVINKDAEVVGLAFDGNIESNAGYFIYDTVENRMISVASQAIMEVIQDVYKADRITEEMKVGKIIKVEEMETAE